MRLELWAMFVSTYLKQLKMPSSFEMNEINLSIMEEKIRRYQFP